jgi:hypothetical protein
MYTTITYIKNVSQFAIEMLHDRLYAVGSAIAGEFSLHATSLKKYKCAIFM